MCCTRFSIGFTVFVGVLTWTTTTLCLADELRLDAPALLQRAVTRDVHLSMGGGAIQLASGVLYEDDGPAAGFSYAPNEEQLGPRIKIRKELVIPEALNGSGLLESTKLLIGQGGDLTIVVNGQQIKQPAGAEQAKSGNYWRIYECGPLRAGVNQIEISGTGKVWIAREQDFAAGSRERTKHPNRSAKSTDGGQTWDDGRLGTKGDVDGEYYVRVFSSRYRPSGWVQLPVLDLANLTGEEIAPAITAIGPLEIDAQATLGQGTKVTLSVRTGTTYVPDDSHWSAWQALPDLKGTIDQPRGRYCQLRAELATSLPQESPLLREITLRSSPKLAPAWPTKLAVASSQNAEIIRSSIPFEYEPFDHPRLAEFRKQHKLDEVVAVAKDELDLIGKLAVWSSQSWDKGHLSQVYPAWDALEILHPHSDGQPIGGFCQQYNVVFLQACESFGLVGRAISLGPNGRDPRNRSGHEVVEIWSNQFAKWMYIDGNAAWYFVPRQGRVPLSILELSHLQQELNWKDGSEPVEVVTLAESKYQWQGLRSWPGFARPRLIPRSNFLAEKSPLPLHQGMRGWFWTGHHVFTKDTSHPDTFLYSHFVSEPRNWDWSLNQTHLVLEATTNPGELRVCLDTETPGLATFLVDLDQKGAKTSPGEFLWKLHPGTNRLEARTRNIAGREGVSSTLVLEYGG